MCTYLNVTEFSELARVREKLRNQSQSATKNDQVVRELQNREQDLIEALAAKDSQLAILRVRLEEGDRDLQNKQKQVEELLSEKNRYPEWKLLVHWVICELQILTPKSEKALVVVAVIAQRTVILLFW